MTVDEVVLPHDVSLRHIYKLNWLLKKCLFDAMSCELRTGLPASGCSLGQNYVTGGPKQLLAAVWDSFRGQTVPVHLVGCLRRRPRQALQASNRGAHCVPTKSAFSMNYNQNATNRSLTLATGAATEAARNENRSGRTN